MCSQTFSTLFLIYALQLLFRRNLQSGSETKNFSFKASCANNKGRFKWIVQLKPNTSDEIFQPIPFKNQPTQSRTSSTELALNQMTEALQMRSGNFLAGFGTRFSACQSTQNILIFSLVSWKFRPIGEGWKIWEHKFKISSSSFLSLSESSWGGTKKFGNTYLEKFLLFAALPIHSRFRSKEIVRIEGDPFWI